MGQAVVVALAHHYGAIGGGAVGEATAAARQVAETDHTTARGPAERLGRTRAAADTPDYHRAVGRDAALARIAVRGARENAEARERRRRARPR